MVYPSVTEPCDCCGRPVMHINTGYSARCAICRDQPPRYRTVVYVQTLTGETPEQAYRRQYR